MKMDQKTAKRLLVEGGTFIFLDVPEGTEFGIDMKSWNTGESFRGVKMIPPGLHYIFYSAVGIMGETAPRTGFFYNFRQSEVLVKKWDVKENDMSDEIVSEGEIVRLKESILALDRFLGPYPYEIFERWKGLSSHITEQLSVKLSPTSGRVQSALELQACNDADRPRFDKSEPSTSKDGSPSSSKQSKRTRLSSSEDVENSLLPNLKPKEGTDLRSTLLPDKTYPDGATGAEITKHSLDSSYTLDLMVSNYLNAIDLIGELEFMYICFLVGHSLEAFEHWKKLVGLLCSCERAIKKYRGVYDAFISLLELQIREIPEDFLADIVSNNNFVYVKLRDFFRAVIECDVDGRLKSKAERLKECLTQEYCWDFSHLQSDDEDDAPVVVDLGISVS